MGTTTERGFYLPEKFERNYHDEMNDNWALVESVVSGLSDDGTVATFDSMSTKGSTVTLADNGGGNQALHNIGNGSRKTSTGVLRGSMANLESEGGGLRGFDSLVRQYGAGNPTFGYHTKVSTFGTEHNQAIGFYAEIRKDDGEVGDLPPTVGFYVDSKQSSVRPHAVLLDDGASVWEHGIRLVGDYTGFEIQSPNFEIHADGKMTIPTVSSAPPIPYKAGQMWFREDLGEWRGYDGTSRVKFNVTSL